MNWRDELKFHEDTMLIVEIAERFLCQYFGHDHEYAESILTEYFRRFGKWFDEGFVRDEHSWRLALSAHYCIHLGGSRSDVDAWRRNEGLIRTPPEALEYLRTHYWNRGSGG